MKISVAIISIAQKSMAGISIRTAIQHRTPGFKLGIYHILPLGIIKIYPFIILKPLVISEIFDQCLCCLHIIAAAAIQIILHVDAYATSIHKRSHLAILSSIGCRIAVHRQHIVPLELSRAEIKAELRFRAVIAVTCI